MNQFLRLCISLIFLAKLALSSVTISAKYDDASTKTVNFHAKQHIHLSCNVSSNKIEVKWEKDDVPINKVKALNSRTKESKDGTVHKLKIQNSVDQDAGNYSCVAYENGDKIISARVAVISNIGVKVVSNLNVIEGEKLRLQCNVIGQPYPKLHWYYHNDTYNETFETSKGRIILEEDTEKHVPNAILQIEHIEMYDRGHYKCIGKSEVSDEEVTSDCMVRVKDKYAALWPFLGICAEVFVLCAIIFIYEKKRNKTELEESDTDQGAEQKNTPDNGKESNLRHRQ